LTLICNYTVSPHKTPSTVSPHKTPATVSPHKTQTSSEQLNKYKSNYKQQQPFSYVLIATFTYSSQHLHTHPYINVLYPQQTATRLASRRRVPNSSLPNEQEALRILHRCANNVAPLMRHHSLKVQYLSEISNNRRPRLRGFLDYTKDNICLRLRYPNDTGTFLPTYEIMQTLIHELTHISHGFHFMNFLRLNDALIREVREHYETGAIGAVPSWGIPVDAGSGMTGCGGSGRI
jgi:hypothetical protein